MDKGLFLLNKTLVNSSQNCLYDSAEEEWWNGKKLTSAIQSLSSKLKSKKKLLVFCFCQNTIGSTLSYLSTLCAGHAVALFDSKTDPAKQAQLIERYKPDRIICPASTVIGMDLGIAYSEPMIFFNEQAIYERKLIDRADPINSDLTLLLSTSGSTGSPKLVRLSRQNLEANAKFIVAALEIDHTERAITSLPIHYSFGLSVLNSHLLGGGSLVLTEKGPLERSFWKSFDELDCTSFSGVPFLYQLLERIHFERMNLPSLRTMTQAGGKMPQDRIRKFHSILSSKKARLVVMYGQTEATARMTYLPPERLDEKIGSVGIPIPGGSIQIRTGHEMSRNPNQRGEIIYSGPNVMMGYAMSRQDLQKGNETGSILSTGDLGYLDEEGFLYVTGRKKRFSKLFGHRINLDDIEGLMNRYGSGAVVGNDEKIHIFCSHGDNASYEEYARKISSKIKIPMNSICFQHIKSIPRTSSGKPDYRKLETIAWN